MNILIDILACFALLGLIDEIIGGRMRLAKPFREGLQNMGSMTLSMAGFYAIGIAFVQDHAEAISRATAGMPFDSTLIIGCILAPDMGGLNIAMLLAENEAIACFTGAMLAGSIGATVSFQIPFFLGILDRSEHPLLVKGFAYGIITVPLGLLAGGAFIGLPAETLLANTVPVLILCVFLLLALLLLPKGTLKVLGVVAEFLRILGLVLFALVCVGVMVPELAIADEDIVKDVLFIVFRIIIVTCGSCVLAELLMRYASGGLRRFGRVLGINEPSVLGLILSLMQSAAMIPLYPKMNRKGKLFNGAISIAAAYVMGGQLVFVSSLLPDRMVTGYVISKLVSGITALILTGIIERRQEETEEQIVETAK